MLKKLKEIDEGSENHSKITLLDANNEVSQAWIDVTSNTINNCFKKAGIVPYWSEEDDLPLRNW